MLEVNEALDEHCTMWNEISSPLPLDVYKEASDM